MSDAQFVGGYAYLNTQFGLDLACRKLGKTPEEIEAIVGRYKRGKRKGELKGKLEWCKLIRGGWVKMGAYDHDGAQGNGFVARMVGFTFNYVIRDAWSNEFITSDNHYSDDIRHGYARAIESKREEVA